MDTPIKIGVLALQGDFDAHRRMLEGLGAQVTLVKRADQLAGLDGLVIPGGESTAFLKLLDRDGWNEKLADFVKQKPTFGTCAGAILLAKEVENPPQSSLKALDVRVQRNAYGRQLESTIRSGETTLGDGPMEMVFIRAPRFARVGKGVEVLARAGDEPVLVRQGRVMAATYHPELSDDTRVHRAFLDMARKARTH